MGIFDGLFNSQGGAIGAVLGSYRTKKFDDSKNSLFLPSLKPGTVIVQGPVKANYVSGGIQGATNSFWTHVLIMAGYRGGLLIREAWGKADRHLLKYNKKTNKFNRVDFPLNHQGKISQYEFVEATVPKVRIGDLEKDYCNKGTQQIAFIFDDLSDATLLKILDYAYSRVGTVYDVGQIAGNALPAFQLRHHKHLHGCSSLIASSFCRGGRAITDIDVAPYDAFPKHIYSNLYPRKEISIAKWNC
ncbi:MAG: hypothetical protein GY928_20675 [Colwellia sp.]|nr:hypothetical protein [Colwellia sp.]